MSRSPGIAVLGSRCVLKKRLERVGAPVELVAEGAAEPAVEGDGRSSGTNEPASTWWCATAAPQRVDACRELGLSWAWASESHASSVSGLGASVRGTSVSAPIAAA